MMSSYPLSRCPTCKKAFRIEVKSPTTLSPILGLMACPHCGLKFQRFDPKYLNASARPLSLRSISNFG
jgi:DNA-directed RNA polymerase subunit RPC12/RpoP